MRPMQQHDIDDHGKPVLGRGALSAGTLKAANINPETGLATDYLNHFNEVVMLMEMLADMPDCAEDVLDWAPADYCRHFAQSSFKDRDLAIAAYDAAPPPVRAHLETLIRQIDAEVLGAQERLRADTGTTTCVEIGRLATDGIRPLIAAAAGAIHGRIDPAAERAEETAQADIDALFG